MVIWSMYAAYMTLLMLNKIFVNASHDIEVSLNDSVSIGCSPPVPMDIQWHHTGHMKHREFVYAGRNFYSPYKGRFQFDNYSLLIPSVNSDDAGLYECSEEISGRQLNSVHLTVLKSIPVCGSNMKSHGYVGPSTCNLEQEDMTFTCAVSYNGKPPQMSWTTLNDSQAFNKSTCKPENGRINCSLILKADPKYDGSIFTCKSTRTSANCRTDVIRIQYFESHLHPVEKNTSEKVNCSVNSNQILQFKWTKLQGNEYVTVVNNQTLLIQSPGSYRCIVEYRIRNAKCSAYGTEVLVLDPSISRSETGQTGTSAIIVPWLIAVICVAGIIITVVLYRRRSKKLKRRRKNIEEGSPMLNADEKQEKMEQQMDESRMQLNAAKCDFHDARMDLNKEKDSYEKSRKEWEKEKDELIRFLSKYIIDEKEEIMEQQLAESRMQLDAVIYAFHNARMDLKKEKDSYEKSKREWEKEKEGLIRFLSNCMKGLFFSIPKDSANHEERSAESRIQAKMENLPLEMLDMILLKTVRRMMGINSSEAFKSFDELMYQVLNHLRTISLLWDSRLHATEWVKIQLRRLRDTSKEAIDNTKKGVLDCYANFVIYVDLSTKCMSLNLLKDVAREKFSDTFVKGSNKESRCRAFLDHLFTEGHPLAFLALRQVLRQTKADILDYVDGRKAFTMPEDESLFLSNDEIKEIVSRKDIYSQLMTEMDPDRLGDWLKQERVISIDEWQETIAPLVNIKDRRRSTLEYLSTISHPRAYIILRQVLFQENPKIASAIDNATTEAEKKYDTLNQVMKHREFLMERMDPEFGLLHSLRANGILTNDEFEEIETQTTSRRLNGRLLDCISKNRSRNTAELFIEALTETDQGHLVNYMISDGVYDSKFADEWPLTETEIQFIDSNYEALVDLLDIDAPLTMLYASDVINKRQREFIGSKPTSRKRNESFLKILKKTSLRNYKETILCLRKSNQNHIAEILEKGEGADYLSLESQRDKLIEIMESDFGLPEKLMKMRAVSFNQCEEIRYSSTRRRKNEMILDFIMQNGKYQYFKTALSESFQTHLVNYISSNGEYRSEFGLDWPLTEREHVILNDNEEHLIDILDTSELLPRLYSKRVINVKQRNFISSMTTDEARNEALLGMIRRLSKASYLTLIKCLKESDQAKIADILENGGALVPVHATLETGNLDETETQILDEFTNLLMQRNVSAEQANRLLSAAQLNIIAVKRGQ